MWKLICTFATQKRLGDLNKMEFSNVHHIAIISTDYNRSKKFYTEVLGLNVIAENYRMESQSWKIDLALNGTYIIELFIFQNPPQRPSYPEAAGLRHLAFEVDDIEKAVAELDAKGVNHESIRIDPYTCKRFVFFNDPDNLPLEIYEK